MSTFHNPPTDEFKLSGRKFHLPVETLHLDPKLKREMTICNLFVNHHLSAMDIIRILDEKYENVVISLIKHHIVLDRRQRQAASPSKVERRRSTVRAK